MNFTSYLGYEKLKTTALAGNIPKMIPHCWCWCTGLSKWDHHGIIQWPLEGKDTVSDSSHKTELPSPNGTKTSSRFKRSIANTSPVFCFKKYKPCEAPQNPTCHMGMTRVSTFKWRNANFFGPEHELAMWQTTVENIRQMPCKSNSNSLNWFKD